MKELLVPDGLVKYIAIGDSYTVKKIRYKQLQELLRTNLKKNCFLQVRYESNENEKKYFSETGDEICLIDKEGYSDICNKYKKDLMEELKKLTNHNEFYFKNLLMDIMKQWSKPTLQIPDGFVKCIAIGDNQTVNTIQYRNLIERIKTTLYDKLFLEVKFTTDENEKNFFSIQGDEICLTDKEGYSDICDKYKEEFINNNRDLKHYDIIQVLNLLIDTRKRWNETKNIQLNNKEDIVQDM